MAQHPMNPLKTYLGVVSQGHDASVALIRNGEIKFAGHAERYSKKKNDGDINAGLLEDCFSYGTPDEIVFYERPMYKRLRHLLAGQFDHAFSRDTMTKHLRSFGLTQPIRTVGHHHSHAAAGYYTSKSTNAIVIVIDAIGEMDTTSIWLGQGSELRMRESTQYPNSMGLLYSAFTHRIGLKPNEEEYILMGMAAYGDPKRFFDDILLDFGIIRTSANLEFPVNVHQGIMWWKPELTEKDYCDVAAAIQLVYTKYLEALLWKAWEVTGGQTRDLVLMGGCALNCVANSTIRNHVKFEKSNIWIMPNPGDAGSSIGAVAAHTHQHMDWKSPYLGYNIDRELDIPGAVAALEAGKVIAVANGRAEFGPRALGNRSILADPRGSDVKDRVNNIKKRELFRPFAPAILAEHASKYFRMPVEHSPYMQFTATCKMPDEFPAICHHDNTSRVQTVTRDPNSKFHELLTAWYEKTGCPMLLNTSLNIKGQPLVNDLSDAADFQQLHNIPVF